MSQVMTRLESSLRAKLIRNGLQVTEISLEDAQVSAQVATLPA